MEWTIVVISRCFWLVTYRLWLDYYNTIDGIKHFIWPRSIPCIIHEIYKLTIFVSLVVFLNLLLFKWHFGIKVKIPKSMVLVWKLCQPSSQQWNTVSTCPNLTTQKWCCSIACFRKHLPFNLFFISKLVHCKLNEIKSVLELTLIEYEIIGVSAKYINYNYLQNEINLTNEFTHWKTFSSLTENKNLRLSHFVKTQIVYYITLYSIHEVTL